MDEYRIRIYSPAGVEMMNRPFADSAKWSEYWETLISQKSLAGFAGNGLLIFSKEKMTEGGNWEPKDRIPVATGVI